MSLTPFHINCPYTDMVVCRCEKYLGGKRGVQSFADVAYSVYQLYSKADPEYAKEFGLDQEEGPTISYRVTVNAKTAGVREVPVLQSHQGMSGMLSPNRQMMTQPSPVQFSSPPPSQQNWMRYGGNARNASMQPTSMNMQQQSTPRPPPLPQPTTPQQQSNFRTPFNNSNIKIISSNSNVVQQPTPIKDQQRTISPTPPTADSTPRITKRNRLPRSVSSSNDSKKKGRPRRRRACDECGEGDPDDNKKDKNILQCMNCKMCIHTHCHDPNLDHVPLQYRDSWRCEDCKICEKCMEAGDEDQLLICETCDRGFHTYCLQPPLQQIPKGSWTCNECKNPQPQPQIQYVPATPPPQQPNNPFLTQYAQLQQNFTIIQKDNNQKKNNNRSRVEEDDDDDKDQAADDEESESEKIQTERKRRRIK